MLTPRSAPASESSSSLLTWVTWALVVCGIGAVGIVALLIIRDSFRGNEEVVVGQPTVKQRQAALLPAASRVEGVTAMRAPAVAEKPATIQESLVELAGPTGVVDLPDALLEQPEAPDEQPVVLGLSGAAAVAEAPVTETVTQEQPSQNPSPPVASIAEAPAKPRKLRLPPRPLYEKRFDGIPLKRYTLTYDTPEGDFRIKLDPDHPDYFRVTTPQGTEFTSGDFRSHTTDKSWGGLVVIENTVYLATDGAIYQYRAEPEEAFMLVGLSPGIQTHISGSLDQYFLLYAPTGGWDPHGEFLGLLDLREGDDGRPEWQLITYEGNNKRRYRQDRLRYLHSIEADTKRQLLTLHFCKPDNPAVVRGKGAKQEYVTVTFDVATETFLPDTEGTLATSE